MSLPSPTLFSAAGDRPVLVGFSGGLDSTVLLHLLAHTPQRREHGLRALHVHHGLHANADFWAAHCEKLCRDWNVPMQVVQVNVATDAGNGLEAAARDARHTAFAQALQPQEWLAVAHHQDDQAETFLLRALRGSGVDGLAAMRPLRAFAEGQLWRPLLSVPRADLLVYAQQHQLRWIEDPSNAHDDYDRNFLRLQVMPLLAQRWPQLAGSFARSAALAGDAADLLATQDQLDLQSCSSPDNTLSLPQLNALPAVRRARVLRAWVRQQQLPPLPANGVDTIEQQLLSARADLQATFAWHGAQITRWREQLHAFIPAPPWPSDWSATWNGDAPLSLPDGSRLLLIGASAFDTPLQVRARSGGERIQLPKRDHSHALKQLLQESDIPPWQRAQLPLLWRGDELLAAGTQIVSAALQHWLEMNHARLQWQPAPTSN